MKNKTLLSASLALMVAVPMQAQKIEDNFEDNFEDKTLRLDYIVAGDSVNQVSISNRLTATLPGREEKQDWMRNS